MEESDGDLMGDGVNIAARLEGIAKPGAICLSEQADRQVKSRLDLKVSDLGPTELKNIAEPIRVYALQVGVPAQATPSRPVEQPAPKTRSALAPLAGGFAALLILIAGSAWYLLGAGRSPPTGAAHLSIVVLPFTIFWAIPPRITSPTASRKISPRDLPRIHSSFVIARNTAFTFRGKNADAKAIGKELGVRYVLEGSVQRDQQQGARVNANLVDAETGAHLWADRFEEDVADLFKLQDQVVARLAYNLGLALIKAEAEKEPHSVQNPDVLDLAMRGRYLLRLSPAATAERTA